MLWWILSGLCVQKIHVSQYSKALKLQSLVHEYLVQFVTPAQCDIYQAMCHCVFWGLLVPFWDTSIFDFDFRCTEWNDGWTWCHDCQWQAMLLKLLSCMLEPGESLMQWLSSKWLWCIWGKMWVKLEFTKLEVFVGGISWLMWGRLSGLSLSSLLKVCFIYFGLFASTILVRFSPKDTVSFKGFGRWDFRHDMPTSPDADN